MPLDARKRTTAIVYVNTLYAEPPAGVPLVVTLQARVGGRLLEGTLRKLFVPHRVRPEHLSVTIDQREDPLSGVQFELPSAWMVAASGDAGFDLLASAALPAGAGAGSMTECDIATVALGCTTKDDRFRLDGVSVRDDLPSLTVRSVPLLAAGQTPTTLARPEEVLSRVIDLLPGGERLNVLPYNGMVDISSSSALTLDAPGCDRYRRKNDLRGCRMANINLGLDAWYVGDRANQVGWDMLMGVHRYDSGEGFIEPGWKRGKTTIMTPGARPTIAVNDGSAQRP